MPIVTAGGFEWDDTGSRKSALVERSAGAMRAVERLHARGRGRNAHRRLELPLAGVRKAAGKTQVQVAEAIGMAQGDVSRLEDQDDMKLSTLRRYAEALGARVDVAFDIPTARAST